MAAALLAAVSCSPAPPSAPAAKTCPASSENLPPRAVAGLGTDVFVAKVTGIGGVVDGISGPIQTYQADASAPLMGSANGPVLIGVGSVLINGKPCRYGIALPEVGRSYLIAGASYDSVNHVFAVGTFEGQMTALTDAEIAKIGTPEEPASVKAMREAVKSPIYPTI
ncbi:hypothetical protein P5V34_04665 [Mycobacteroides abscessus subsp. abscessus]|nr:hypothetical protein [Mycobacteroides abscessus subsp. abscessus]